MLQAISATQEKTLITPDQRKYNATINARNKFTKEFASQWSDSEIRVLALFKYYFKKADSFLLAGNAGAKFCYISRPTWIKITQKLEALGLIEVIREKLPPPLNKSGQPRNKINSYYLSEGFKAHLRYAHTQIIHERDKTTPKQHPPHPVKRAVKASVKTGRSLSKNFTPFCKAPLQDYKLFNYNNLNTTTKTPSSEKCRSALPPNHAEKGAYGQKFSQAISPERVGRLEERLADLKQFHSDTATMADTAKDGDNAKELTENSHFFKTLLALNHDIYKTITF